MIPLERTALHTVFSRLPSHLNLRVPIITVPLRATGKDPDGSTCCEQEEQNDFDAFEEIHG